MSIAQFKLSLNVKIYVKLRFRAETRVYLFGGLGLNWVKKIEKIFQCIYYKMENILKILLKINKVKSKLFK